MHNQRRKHKSRVRARRRKTAAIFAVSVAVLLGLCIQTVDSKGVTTETPEATTVTASEAATERETTTDIIGVVLAGEQTRIEQEDEEESESDIGSRDWSADDAEILLKISMAEAEGESTEGKALVMLVVLNRVWSDEFPDTIAEVVFQEGQFSPTMEGGRYYTTEPDEDCYAALELIESGWDESMGALYFESCENADNWHSNNLTHLFQYGNHRFYI